MLRNKARSLGTTAAKHLFPDHVGKNLHSIVKELPLAPKQHIAQISFGSHSPGPLLAGARAAEEVHAFANKEFWRRRHAWSGGLFNAGSHKSSLIKASSPSAGVVTRAFGVCAGSCCNDARLAGSWALRCLDGSKCTETAGATFRDLLGPPSGRILAARTGGSLQRCFASQPHPSTTAQVHTPKPTKPPQPSESGSGSSGGAGAGEHGGKPAGSSRFWRAVTALQAVPLVPLVLGFAGAIPFIALSPPLAPLLPLPEELRSRHAEAQAAYGAVILSFLGAVHWGLAMAGHAGGVLATFTTSSVRYVWGVTPALLAWSALLLEPAECFAALAASLGLVFLVDAGFARLGLLPAWYLPLRLPLTIAAVASLLSSWSVAAAQTALIEARKKLAKPQPTA